MSDEEYSESEEETQPTPEAPKTPVTPKAEPKEPEFMKIQESKISAIDEQLKEYIVEWRKQKAKEEEELKKLKEKQAKRKVQRAEENRLLAEKKKLEEERKAREAEEQKQKDAEERRRKLEEAEKKRQAMMEAMKAQSKMKGRKMIIPKSAPQEPGSVSAAQMELSKTKEQIEEEKQAALKVRIKTLNIENLSQDKLKDKAIELWNCIIKLETEKYDLEEKRKRQDYDIKELKERQKQQLRHKAMKKGLDPEALTGKHPPKIQVASKYERRVDTRTYDDKKKLFNGGFDELTKEQHEADWKKKVETYSSSHHTRLPKWFGERPGKKKGEPDSPEDEVKQDEEDEDIGQPPQFSHEEEEVEEEEVEEEEEDEEEEEEEEEEE